MRPPSCVLWLILPVLLGQAVLACSSFKEKEPRTLRLLIVAAHDLPTMDGRSPTDCWLQVYAGSRLIGRTPKIHNSNAPRFNTELTSGTTHITLKLRKGGTVPLHDSDSTQALVYLKLPSKAGPEVLAIWDPESNRLMRRIPSEGEWNPACAIVPSEGNRSMLCAA